MPLTKLSADAFRLDGPIGTVGDLELIQLIAAIPASPRQRVRINAHQSDGAPIHDMIVAITPNSYVRPHRHEAKSESFHVIRGESDVVIFYPRGEIRQVVRMGLGASRTLFYRLAPGIFHCQIPRSAVFVVHEVTDGPFRPGEGTEFAPWAPDEKDLEAVARYRAELERHIDEWTANLAGPHVS